MGSTESVRRVGSLGMGGTVEVCRSGLFGAGGIVVVRDWVVVPTGQTLTVGTGIPADVQERIFVPFFTTKPDGSGIGLSLCKQIAYQHHGYLSVRSVPGKGSRFVLRIPRKGTIIPP